MARDGSGLPAADPAAQQPERLAHRRLARECAQEVEVAALVGPEHVVEVHRAVAAAVGRLAGAAPVRGGERSPPPGRSRSRRPVAASTTIGSPSRTTRRGPPAADSGETCRTTVPKAVPLIRASEIRTMSVTPAREQLLRDRELAPLGHARARPSARRSASRAPSRGVIPSAGSSIRAPMSSMPSKTTAGPRCESSAGQAALRLRIAPSGARLTAQHGEAALGRERRLERRDHVAVERRPPGRSSAIVRPVTVNASPCRSGAELAEHRADAAGAVELARRDARRGPHVREERRRR